MTATPQLLSDRLLHPLNLSGFGEVIGTTDWKFELRLNMGFLALEQVATTLYSFLLPFAGIPLMLK